MAMIVLRHLEISIDSPQTTRQLRARCWRSKARNATISRASRSGCLDADAVVAEANTERVGPGDHDPHCAIRPLPRPTPMRGAIAENSPCAGDVQVGARRRSAAHST